MRGHCVDNIWLALRPRQGSGGSRVGAQIIPSHLCSKFREWQHINGDSLGGVGAGRGGSRSGYSKSLMLLNAICIPLTNVQVRETMTNPRLCGHAATLWPWKQVQWEYVTLNAFSCVPITSMFINVFWEELKVLRDFSTNCTCFHT